MPRYTAELTIFIIMQAQLLRAAITSTDKMMTDKSQMVLAFVKVDGETMVGYIKYVPAATQFKTRALDSESSTYTCILEDQMK